MRVELAFATCLALSACDAGANFGSTIDLAVEGEVLVVNGTINSQSFREFSSVMAANPQIAVVELQDVQGSTDEMVVAEMGYDIRARGFATRVAPGGQVFSGGVDLFLAGVRRSVGAGAILGVHEWESGLGRARDYPRGDPWHEPTRTYIEDMLGSDAFYWFTLEAAAFDEVHIMSRAEMVAFGLVTQ